VRFGLLSLGLASFHAPIAGAGVVRPEVVRSYAHDAGAFTQGLVFHQGSLYESTGLRGQSSLRRVALRTGAVEARVELANDLFGEGLALVGERLIQLTWQNRVALVYDLALNRLGGFEYDGEGWGLCDDGRRLIMSDGSNRLFFRNRDSFELIGSMEVSNEGQPVRHLNELECVGSLVYANVWQTDAIVRIDATTGSVLSTIDASRLLTPEEAARADVLNGIAHDPESGHFFITGKLWPRLFEVRLALDAAGAPDPAREAPKPSAAPQGGTTVAPEPTRSDVAPNAKPGSLPRTAAHNCACRLGISPTGAELASGPLVFFAWFLRRGPLKRRRKASPSGARAASGRRAETRPRS
jgi:glutamine cyclotransferase